MKLSESYEPLLPWFREAELRHGRTAVSYVIVVLRTMIDGRNASFSMDL